MITFLVSIPCIELKPQDVRTWRQHGIRCKWDWRKKNERLNQRQITEKLRRDEEGAFTWKHVGKTPPWEGVWVLTVHPVFPGTEVLLSAFSVSSLDPSICSFHLMPTYMELHTNLTLSLLPHTPYYTHTKKHPYHLKICHNLIELRYSMFDVN